MMAGTRLGLAVALAFTLIDSQPAIAGESLTLAAGRSEASTYRAGVGLSSLIKFELLPKDKIDLRTLESAGAIENVRLLQADEAQLAILPSAIGHAARLGIGSFAGDPPETGLRAIAALWRDALHLVVRANDVATGTIDDLSGLKERKLYLGSPSSGMVDANQLLLADLGMTLDQNVERASVIGGDVIAAVKRGEIDAVSATFRPPEDLFEGIFDKPASNLRLLDVTDSQMTRANGNHWLWTPYVIPADTYPGQNDEISTIGLSNLLVVRADVDDEVIYAITRSIFENLSYLKRVDPAMANLSLENALDGMAMPLHPGAHRYFSESGMIPTADRNDKATSPDLLPVKQKNELPGSIPSRYPDANVAGEWPAMSAGGPLLKTTSGNTASDRNDLPEKPEPHWKRRVTF